MSRRRTRSDTRLVGNTAESESVARGREPLSPPQYVTQSQFSALETQLAAMMALLHDQSQRAIVPPLSSTEVTSQQSPQAPLVVVPPISLHGRGGEMWEPQRSKLNSPRKLCLLPSSKRKRKTAIGLMQVIQDKDESLQEYLARFNRATLSIRDLQMSVVVTALMNGTRNRAFKMSLSKNPPESMHDLLKKGDKYVDAEEAEKITKKLRDGREAEVHKRKTYDEQRHTDKNKPKNERINKGYAQDRTVKQKREKVRTPTPLNIPRTKLLMEIQHMKELEWPKPMLTPSDKRNQSKYCHFHRDQGHDTEECLQLKEEIERLLRRGLLAKYVKNDKGKQRLEGLPPPRAGVINMIIEGIASGGDSNSTRKSYARSVGVCSIQKKARFNQSITFDQEDLIDVTHPHDDALVIVGDIADFDVKRLLVDGGSAANVLTWDAFLGLKVPQEKLKMVTTPLQGFGGATVIPEGTMELSVTLGTYPATVVIVTNFLVVKTPMAYNVIYGRPLLNAASAVPSTYHQVMKFPTSRGIGCV
ncbi:uncharacterized protein LOC111389058 [Olea europaea var. sylvestris]|uniref:uncharacterized protein LOC111389058 n=1 Tax=Olea europaea var. sylvestris TaxID=158386 RepID=UPI000C1CE72B|nr:uncharacterized protein LOC111389058 [Olea europaea var. sylvestris]